MRIEFYVQSQIRIATRLLFGFRQLEKAFESLWCRAFMFTSIPVGLCGVAFFLAACIRLQNEYFGQKWWYYGSSAMVVRGSLAIP